MRKKKYYTYALAYPDSMGGLTFYIGKGAGDRIYQHERIAKHPDSKYPRENRHKTNIIRKIWANGEQVVRKKLAYFDTDEEASLYEIALIFLMETPLTNITAGGDTPPSNKGKKATEATIARMSQGMKRRLQNDPALREHHIQTLQNRTITQSYREKLSRARVGMTFSDTHKSNLSKSHMGQSRPWTDEHRNNFMAAINRRRTST